MADKETRDTQTFMLPDWQIEAMKNAISKALAKANMDLPHPIKEGYMQGTLSALKTFLDTAKPTKRETFYGGE